MKKIWMMMAMVAIFTACSNEEEFDSQVGNYTLTGYANVESRTAFGTPGDSSIPFAWSANDYIYAGSAKSNAIANGGYSATFNFSSNPSGDVYYNIANIAGSSATEAHVKAEQTAGDLGANGDFGYGTISNGSFTLNHATAYLWFNITALPEGATLQSITFDAGAATIAGKATWDGSKFGSISDGSNSIQLNVNKATVSGAETAMVVYPAVVESASVTYQLSVGGTTKYYNQLLGAKTFTNGTTYKISVNLATADLYELRVLTFEDEDAKFTTYSLDYANKTISKWSDLVDDAQYGGTLTYNNYGEATYYWYDENNTEIEHSFTTPYWGGGHAISNFVIENYETLPEGHYGWYELQFATPIGGHNGSKNFCVHNGYKDDYNSQIYDGKLAWFSFKNGKELVVDHMYVTNTCYALNSLTYGDGFNSPATEDTYFKIVAYGYNANDEEVGTAEFYLCKTGRQFVTDWQKWDLSSLGKVNKIVFNFAASDDQIGSYGLNCPAYFAYDDVAVQFTE